METRNGLSGAVYQNPRTGVVTIAFRGTDSLQGDPAAGAKVALGLWHPQFSDAGRFVKSVMDVMKERSESTQFQFTGHSLGGALAQVMSMLFDRGGVTFDAIGAARLLKVPEYFQLAAELQLVPATVAPDSLNNYIVSGSVVSTPLFDFVGKTQSIPNFADGTTAPWILGLVAGALGGNGVGAFSFLTSAQILSVHAMGGIVRSLHVAAIVSQELERGDLKFAMVVDETPWGQTEGARRILPALVDRDGAVRALIDKRAGNYQIYMPDSDTRITLLSDLSGISGVNPNAILACTRQVGILPPETCVVTNGPNGVLVETIFTTPDSAGVTTLDTLVRNPDGTPQSESIRVTDAAGRTTLTVKGEAQAIELSNATITLEDGTQVTITGSNNTIIAGRNVNLATVGEGNRIDMNGDACTLIDRGARNVINLYGDGSSAIVWSNQSVLTSTGDFSSCELRGDNILGVLQGDAGRMQSYGLSNTLDVQGDRDYAALWGNASVVNATGDGSVCDLRGNNNFGSVAGAWSVLASHGVSNTGELRGDHNLGTLWGDSSVLNSHGVSNTAELRGSGNAAYVYGNASVANSYGVSNLLDLRGNSIAATVVGSGSVVQSWGLSNRADLLGSSNSGTVFGDWSVISTEGLSCTVELRGDHDLATLFGAGNVLGSYGFSNTGELRGDQELGNLYGTSSALYSYGQGNVAALYGSGNFASALGAGTVLYDFGQSNSCTVQNPGSFVFAEAASAGGYIAPPVVNVATSSWPAAGASSSGGLSYGSTYGQFPLTDLAYSASGQTGFGGFGSSAGLSYGSTYGQFPLTDSVYAGSGPSDFGSFALSPGTLGSFGSFDWGFAGSEAGFTALLAGEHSPLAERELAAGNRDNAARAETAFQYVKAVLSRDFDYAQYNGTRLDHDTVTWSLAGPGAEGSGFTGAVGEVERTTIAGAFVPWAEATGLRFVEVQGDDPTPADIRFGWSDLNGSAAAGADSAISASSPAGDASEVTDAADAAIAAPAAPSTGDAAKDDRDAVIVAAITALFPGPRGGTGRAEITVDNAFNLGQIMADIDARSRAQSPAPLGQVLQHEIGHALGLAYSTDPTSIMYPFLGERNRGLNEQDRAAIGALYGGGAVPTRIEDFSASPWAAALGLPPAIAAGLDSRTPQAALT